MIAYKPGHEWVQVVAQFFPNLKVVEAPKGALRGSPVAIFISAIAGRRRGRRRLHVGLRDAGELTCAR